MSTHSASKKHSKPARKFMSTMQPRSPDDKHRASTPLELLFDLVFVVAVALAGTGLHHGLAQGHTVHALISFHTVFFGIWWAWMNSSWFGSAYDNDDVPYRLMVFVQLIGALILAAGVPHAFEQSNFTIVTLGYTIMRFGTVVQWLRAAKSDPLHRPTTLRYAIGVAAVQMGWIAQLFVPFASVWTFLFLVAVEILIPMWAERKTPSTWHAEHIAERYGLFTIIVLGESILSASMAIQTGMTDGVLNVALPFIAFGAALIVFTMWWLYFDTPAHDLLVSVKRAFYWGYGHYFVFSSAAAVGAGVSVAVDHAMGAAQISPVTAGAAVAVPVAIYLMSLWVVHEIPRARSASDWLLFPVGAALILATPFLHATVLWVGLLMVAILSLKLVLVCSKDDSVGV